MTNAKKSFVLYFDMYDHISRLSVDQRGELLSALFEYAHREAVERGSGASVPDEHPAMTPETRMAFSFIALVIFRDTDKWQEKRERYQQAANARHADQSHSPSEKEALFPEKRSARPSSGDLSPLLRGNLFHSDRYGGTSQEDTAPRPRQSFAKQTPPSSAHQRTSATQAFAWYEDF